MTDELDPEGVEFATRRLYEDDHRDWTSLGHDLPPLSSMAERARRRYERQATTAITAYLQAAPPREDGSRDKAEQWDAAQPMIAAMTGVIETAREWVADLLSEEYSLDPIEQRMVDALNALATTQNSRDEPGTTEPDLQN